MPHIIATFLILIGLNSPWTAVARADDADKPRPCSGPEYRQFDFWAGDWNVLDSSGKQVGRNRIERILEGCALAEHWESARGGKGTSLNFYDASRQRWRQTWIDDQGTPLFLEGGLVDGKMVLEGDSPTRRQPGKTIRNRITWSKLEGGRVRQFWEFSGNSGKTWETVFDGTYVRKE